MGKTVRSNTTPGMLTWGRQKANLSLSAAAEKLKVREEILRSWEDGAKSPTFPQLDRLAKLYGYSTAVFYLEEPPKAFTIYKAKVKDFRKVGKASRGVFSRELRMCIADAEQRQVWASEYIRSHGAKALSSLPKILEPSGPAALAGELRSRLRVTREEVAALPGVREAYNFWRRRISSLGVLVFQSTGVPVEEMRGISLPDKFAPAIVVNGADSFSARVFTLVHELTHLCMGDRSISGAGDDLFSLKPVSSIERFCDQVAAETIVPTAELNDLLSDYVTYSGELLDHLASRFKVSRAVVALRLVAIGAVPQRFLDDHRYVFRSPAIERPKREVRIPAPTRVLSRFGRRFTKLVLSAYGNDSIHGGQLSTLLRMKMKHLPALESKIYTSRVSVASPR